MCWSRQGADEPKCEFSSVFPYGPHPNNKNRPFLHQSPHLCPPCQATYGLLEETAKVGITFRMSGCFGALTLSVCLSFPFLFPPQWKHNFPLSLSFPYCWITGPFYSSLGQWYGNASSWGYGMWDAGQAGTKHRKKARVGD